MTTPTYTGIRANLVAAGIALGGARLEVPERGSWRTFCEFPEETIAAIATRWLEQGELDVTVALSDGEPLRLVAEGEGQHIVVGEPCSPYYEIPDALFTSSTATHVQLLAALTGYHMAVRDGRSRFRIKFARQVGDLVMERGFINTDFVFNREWVQFDEKESDVGSSVQQVLDAFETEGIRRPQLEDYVAELRRKSYELGFPSSKN